MKVSVKTKGVVLTSKQKSQIEKQLARLKKFISHIEPVTIEVTFLDLSGPTKGGVDQAVHLNVVLPKETIFIEEVDDRALRAFQFAYKTLERRLRRFADKLNADKRRQQSRFKAVVNVVGGAGKVMSGAAGAVGKMVPRRSKK